MDWNCTCRFFLVASYTIPGPKTGFMNPYTSFWERTSSDALKNGSCASGPIRKVNRLCKNCLFLYLACFCFCLLMLLLLLGQKEAQHEELQGAEGGQCDSKMPLLYAMLEQDDI